MRRSTRHLRSAWLASTIATLASVGSTPAFGQELPSGGVVAAGSATITAQGATTTIRQTSDRAVIDWQRFSIGAGGQVAVEQSHGTSALLNRVKGSEMSRIAGSLTANGQVFLINPNGIIIDQTGKIQARGGFVASTLDIGDDDFMAGKLGFHGGGTGIVANHGYISGGAVALLGSRVANDGMIVSALGRVAMGSAKQATLDLNGDGLLQVAIPSDFVDTDGSGFLSNSGLIDAAGGTVMLKVATAREIVRQTINMAGIIRATSVSQAGGIVLLDGGSGAVDVAGTIDVSGQSGGRIDITGGDVSLTGATLVARGIDRGGLIRVGGAFQGGQASPATDGVLSDRFTTRFGPVASLAAARTTTIDAGSTLDASGGAAGGAVVAWSSTRTQQSGIVTANGMTGGAVELSSKGRLTTNLGRVTPGPGGTLLLDPKNIFVYNSFALSSGTSGDPITGTVGYGDNPGADATFDVADIKTLMDGGTDVFLRASNDINWSADLGVSFTAANPGDLSLSAGRSVNIGGFLTLNQANLTVVANDTLANGVIDADRDAGAAEINAFDAQISGAIDSGGTGGNIRLTLASGAGLTNTATDGMRLTSIAARSITIDAGSDAVSLFDLGGGSGAASLDAAEALRFTGAIRVQTGGGLTLSGRTVNWLNEAGAALTATSPATTIRFLENGVVTRYGVLDGGQSGGAADTTRVALGKGLAGIDYSAVYGTTYGTFDGLHLVSGTLKTGDTIGGLFATGAVTTAGPAAGQGVGSYAVTNVATAQFGLAAGISGYFVDLRTVADTLQITPKTLTATVAAGNYTYGTPASVASLTGLVGSDSVGLLATVTGLGTQAMSGIASGYAFAANLAAGQRSFTLTGLTGAAAGNYTLDLSGTIGAALTISPRLLTYAGTSATSTYGTLNTASFTLSGALSGDDVAIGLAGVSRGGVTSTLTATTGVGTYATTASALTGSAAGNYAIDTANSSVGSAIIDPKALIYSASSVTTTYGTLATVAIPTLSGIVAGDDVGATRLLGGQVLTLTDRTAAGSYAITPGLTGTAAGNYSVATIGNAAGTLTINPLLLGFSVGNVTQSYASPAAIATLSGVLSGDEVYAVGGLSGSNAAAVAVGSAGIGYNPDVGSYSFLLTAIGGAQSGNYRIDRTAAPILATLTVVPRAVTYSISGIDKIYGSSASAPTITFNDVINASLSAAIFATNPSGVVVGLNDLTNGVGTYSLGLTPGSLSGPGSQNYVLATTGNAAGVMTIRPRTIGYTGTLANSTYGTLASLGSVAFTNLVNGDSLGAVTALLSGTTPVTLDARTAAGVYSVAVTGITGAAAGNYVLGTGLNGQLTIDRRTIGYTLGSATSVYGTLANLPYTLTNVLAGDDVAPVVLAGGAAVSDRTSAGSYVTRADTLTGTSAGNYRLSATRSFGALTVTPKPITYVIGASTSVYGDAYDFSGAVTFDGVLAGETAPTVQAQFVGGTEQIQTFDDYRNVGTYAVEALITGNPNYLLSAAGNALGTYTITQRPITLDTRRAAESYGVRAVRIGTGVGLNNILDRSKVFTTLTLPSFPLSTGGYVNAGSYVATAGALQGEKAGNYVLTGTNSVTITVAAGTLGILPGSAQATYGSVGSLANSGRVSALPGDVVAADAFNLARNGAAVTVTSQTPVGGYDIVAGAITGADAANYSYTPVTIGQFYIAPKPITYTTGDVSSVYGTAPAEPTVTFSGLVGDDQVAALPTGYTVAVRAGTYSGLQIPGLTGAAAGNYTLAASGNVFGTLTVAPKPLTYSFNPATLIYGSTIDPNGLVTLDGIVNGDTVFATLYTRRTAAAAGSPFVIGATDALAFGNPGAFGAVNGGTAQLSAGIYQLTFGADAGAATARLTGGSDAANYTLPITTQTPVALTVLPRSIRYQVTSQAVSVYGDAVPLDVSFSGTLGGAAPAYTIIQTKDGYASAIGAISALPANLDASLNYSFDLRLQGADAFNYDATGNMTQLAVLKKEVTARYGAVSGVYGDALANLITIPGVLAGDELIATVEFDGTRESLTNSGAGFGIGQLLRNTGTVQFSLQNVTGTDAGNYIFYNAGGRQALTITPRPVTYVSSGFTALYGGLSLPTCNVGCEFDTRPIGYEIGTATVSGILDIDTAAVGYDVKLTDGRTIFDYNENTNAGTYAKTIALFGDATKVNNYVVSQQGSSAGAVFILPAPLKVSISSGGRLYTDAAKGIFQTIGTPGVVSYLRSNGVDGSRLTGLVTNDVVTPVLALQTKAGVTVDASQTLPIGDYAIVPIALAGSDAGNYRLIADPGELTVDDAGLFNFGNLIDGSNSVYVAPAAISKPPVAAPVTPRPSGTLTTTEIEGETSTSFQTDGASLEAGAGASGTVSTTSSAGDNRVSIVAEGEAGAEVKLAPGKVEAEATAGGSVGVSLEIGPGFIDYGAYLQAEGSLEINLFSREPSIELTAMVKAGVAATTGVGGALGGGVSGELSSNSEAFLTAFSENKMSFKNGKLTTETQNFVGAGLSTGITLGASGGGVSGSASATVFSPGSLYIGVKSDSGYANQTFSINFSLGLAIGIGGLQLGVDLSFSTEKIEQAGALIVESWETVGRKQFYTELGDDLMCNGACQRERATARYEAEVAAKAKWEAEAPARAEAARQAANAKISAAFNTLPKNASGRPTPEQLAFVMSSPEAQAVYWWIAKDYGQPFQQVNDLAKREQNLARKMSSDPKGVTVADIKAAQQLRAEEAGVLAKLRALDAQVVVENGVSKMVWRQ
ncbi:MAG TPA: filamentous hemagglutinin N-terminal domain-containing protein [Sphingomicrobium sp.]|jgi:filamentous hemagglutinin family protein